MIYILLKNSWCYLSKNLSPDVKTVSESMWHCPSSEQLFILDMKRENLWIKLWDKCFLSIFLKHRCSSSLVHYWDFSVILIPIAMQRFPFENQIRVQCLGLEATIPTPLSNATARHSCATPQRLIIDLIQKIVVCWLKYEYDYRSVTENSCKLIKVWIWL
jgi:hypothetical protein